jgi:hypothetical protein
VIIVDGAELELGEEMIMIEELEKGKWLAEDMEFEFEFPEDGYIYRFQGKDRVPGAEGKVFWHEAELAEMGAYQERLSEIKLRLAEEMKVREEKIRTRLAEVESLSPEQRAEMEEKLVRLQKERQMEIEERLLAVNERAREIAEQAEQRARKATVIVGERGRDGSVWVMEGSVNSRLEAQLLRDGLIDSPENYRFKLSRRFLKVDGKKQSEALFQKYKSLYEAWTGTEIDGKTEINISKKSN